MAGESDEVTLFNNLADPYQMENIAESRPDLVIKLNDEMHGWLTRIHDPWMEDPGS
jgi:hypothetical protein